MKHLFVSLLLLVSFNFVSATTIYWVGGVGNWDDAANWNINQVPQTGDVAYISGANSEVIIPGYFQAEAIQVQVYDQATLIVDGQLLLTKVNLAPLLNHGQIYVNGQVEIKESGVSNNIGYRGHGNSLLEIAPNAEMNIIALENGVKLYDNAIATIRGDMHIVENTAQAFTLSHQSQVFIENGGLLYFEDIFQGLFIEQQCTLTNDGEIVFSGNVESTPITVYLGELINNSNGSIKIHDSGSQAIGNTGVVRNYGEILITNAGRFVSSHGSMINSSNAYLKMISSDHLIVSGPGELIQNYGVIDIKYATNTAIAVTNDAILENHSSGKVYVDGINTNQGIEVDAGGELNNEGFIRINVPSDKAIYMIGTTSEYNNLACGRTGILGGGIHIQNTGTFTNNSWLFLKDPNANHTISNTTFINNGVIADRFATLSGLNYSNQGFVTNPLQGPLVNGQAVPNAFTLGSTANVSNPSIRISHNGPSAGSYSLSTNTYIPNSAAVGDNDLRLRITLNGCGAKWFRIPVINPTPFVGQTSTNLNFTDNKQDGQIFPNPAVADIQITHNLAQEGSLQLELWTLNGQLISQQNYETFPGEPLRFSRPSGLPNGSYLIRLISQDQAPTTLRIIWQ